MWCAWGAEVVVILLVLIMVTIIQLEAVVVADWVGEMVSL
jgi:hypothetical protein